MNPMRFGRGIAIALGIMLLPQHALAVVCGESITASTTLDQDLDCPGVGLVIAGDNLVLDCAGHVLRTAAEPGNIALQLEGGSRLVVRNCHFEGGWFGVRGSGLQGLEIVQSSFAEMAQIAISVVDSSDVRIEDCTFQGDRNRVSVARSSSTRISGNHFEAKARGSAINTSGSPGPKVTGNTLVGGGFIAVLDGEGSVIEENTFRGGQSGIEAIRVSSCSIARNRVEAPPGTGTGGRIALREAWGCDVEQNVLDSVHTYGVLVSDESDERPANRIFGNVLRAGSFGIFLQGPRGTVVEGNVLEGQAYGILALPAWGPGDVLLPGDHASILDNRIERASVGIFSMDSEDLLVADNVVEDCEVGIYEFETVPPVGQPNHYERNRLLGSRAFGMAIVGTSPILQGNLFARTGAAAELSEDAYLLGNLFGAVRATIAIAPTTGDWFHALDDAVPDNDAVPAPTIGDASAPNLFRNNASIDVYALDARPGNAGTLLNDNRFLGRALRYRQDWFGLIRVVDATGSPVSGSVHVSDADAASVLVAVSAPDGHAPADVDPLRSQGRLAFEPEGSAPRWPVFTQFVVDARGRSRALTPHVVRATAGIDSGCATYTWNGLDDPSDDGTSVDGRYQTVIVELGRPCPGVPTGYGYGSPSPDPGDRVTDR